MLIAGFPAGPWGANCYVVAASAGAECLVIDPGQDAAPGVADIVREHRLKPVSVLLTHGHVDHMWSVTPVAGAYDAVAWIHPEDRHLLTDPLAGISSESAAMLLGGKHRFPEPADVRDLGAGMTLELAGLDLTVDHMPGHTRGSVAFRVPADQPLAAADVAGVLFCGDVLFAGSVGRTDLPGCSLTQLNESLRTLCALPPETRVLAGHMDETTIGAEIARNPFVHAALQNQ